jgi:indolepyruvate ferredoxin oxidoreductase
VHIHCRIANRPEDISAIRVAVGEAHCVIGGDLVVTAGARTIGLMRAGQTGAAVNSHEIITGAFTRDTEFRIPTEDLKIALQARLGENLHLFDYSDLARRLLGDSIFSNMMVLGAAWQMGLVPLGEDSILRAIALNGAAVERNTRAFALGRWSVVHPKAAARMLTDTVVRKPLSLDEKTRLREAHLAAYQSERLVRRFRKLVDKAPDDRLKEAIARGYHKLLTYKDESEVARLHLSTLDKARAEFEGDFTPRFHLAPPLLSRMGPDGRPVKRSFGPGMLRVFKLLSRMKALRGTPLDLFGYTAERRMERRLIREYEALMNRILTRITPENHVIAVELAELPLQIRGFGPVKHRNAEAAARRQAELLRMLDEAGKSATLAAE